MIFMIYIIYYKNALKSANPLIARPLSESPNCTAHGNELRLFWIKAFPPYSNNLCRASEIAAEGTIFNVFIYDAVLAEIRTHLLPE